MSPLLPGVGFTTIAIAAAATQSDATVFPLGFIVVVSLGSRACRVRLRITHRPTGLSIESIFIAIPRRSADVEVGVGRFREHDPRTGIANGYRKTAVLCVKGPQDHPVRADRYRRAGAVERCVIAVLGRSAFS